MKTSYLFTPSSAKNLFSDGESRKSKSKKRKSKSKKRKSKRKSKVYKKW